MSTKLVPTTTKANIKWFVYSAGEKIRRNATMRGSWDGWDATCSCGWETKTGGGVRSWIEQEVYSHKRFDHGYEWQPIDTHCEECDNGTDTPCTACLLEEAN